MNTSDIDFHVCTQQEKEVVIDFLLSIGDELHLTKRSEVEEITDLLFAKGGAMICRHKNQVIAMLGYFLGEPAQQYANKEVGFIYVTAIAKRYRLSRLTWIGMGFAIDHLYQLGVKEIRCHARANDGYTNRLYAHFAQPLRTERNRRGVPCILYGNNIDNVMAYLGKERLAKNASIDASPYSTTLAGRSMPALPGGAMTATSA